MGGRVTAGFECGLSDDGLRGSHSSVLNTSHQEVSSHQGDNTLLQLTLSAVRGAAGALHAAVSPIAWSVIGWATAGLQQLTENSSAVLAMEGAINLDAALTE